MKDNVVYHEQSSGGSVIPVVWAEVPRKRQVTSSSQTVPEEPLEAKEVMFLHYRVMVMISEGMLEESAAQGSARS